MVTREFDDVEITVDCNYMLRNQLQPLKVTKMEVEPLINNNTILEARLLNQTLKIQAKETQLSINPENTSRKSPITPNTNIVPLDVRQKEPSPKIKDSVNSSHVGNKFDQQTRPKSTIELPGSSYGRPVHPLPFTGARFVRAQVHSNPVLQSLLKEIVSLNNEQDKVDEDAINQEIARLRAKNNLPSLNAEVPINLEDSDYSEGSDDENCSYYDLKGSENHAKDSGYDNESQYSESLEDDNKSEPLGIASNRSLLITEPEYIDLDNYFCKKRKVTVSVTKTSLVDIGRSSKIVHPANELPFTSEGLTCHSCNKLFKTKKTYRHHTKNGCLKKSNHRLFDCIGTCKFLGTKEELLQHKEEKHQANRTYKNVRNDVVPVSCEICFMPCISVASLKKHSKMHQKQKLACLFCDFVCEDSSEYNLHISSNHSKSENRGKRKSSSSDSDSLQIVELDDD